MSARRRGFTLIELLVALSGGLFVTVVVFALSRDASRFYQRETRTSNATLAAISGFDRLRADIARAGYLVSPNVQTDPWVCSRPGMTAPPLMQRLASIRIQNGGSPSNTMLAANSLTPDAVILAGSYSSADEFPIRAVNANTDGTYSVDLDPANGAMARLGFMSAATPAARTARLASVFAPNRALRILDTQGRQHYGIITAVTSGALGTAPSISLASTIPLQFKATTTRLCGLEGHATGGLANVVNVIRYDVRTLSGNPSYTALFDARAGALGENTRTELVRTELNPADPAGVALLSIDGAPAVEELIAEYAVDLDLEPTVATAAMNPTVSHVLSSNANFGDYTDTGALVQRIRAVRVRLSVRSREGDRGANVPSGASDVAPGLYRVLLGDENGPRYARVRSMQADVQIANNTGIPW
jgi:type II secretory pathway pseudopilin PulG